LRHGAEFTALRTPSTLEALAQAVECDLLGAHDELVLRQAWELASRVRNATVLWRGRPADSLPTNVQELDGVARIVGYPPASAGRLDEDYQRTTRRARAVMERLFYE
jgi:glutamate-ammonia-ligase adenylyltransferase